MCYRYQEMPHSAGRIATLVGTADNAKKVNTDLRIYNIIYYMLMTEYLHENT